jgi:hypothetical protein
LNPAMTWTLSVVSAAPQPTSRAAKALVDTLTRHVGG